MILMVTNDSTVFRRDEGAAEEVFGGRLTEVRNLRDRLSRTCGVRFMIISGEYGLIDGGRRIKRYGNIPGSKEGYRELQERTDFAGMLRDESGRHDGTFLFVPRDMMRLIADKGLEGDVTAVTSPVFKGLFEERGWTFLERRGARVGRENARVIAGMSSSCL